LRQTIDVGHDLLRHRAERVRDALQHEGILHVDDDKRCLARIEVFEDVLPAATGNNTVDHRFRNGYFAHCSLS